MKKTLLPILTFVPIDVKRLFRDKVGIFFVFLFPLIFLIIFGAIFRGDNDVSFRVALYNQSSSTFSTELADTLKNNELFKLEKDAQSIEASKEKMSRSQLDAIIVLPEGFGEPAQNTGFPTGQASVLYSQNNQSAGQALTSVLDGVFKEINAQFIPIESPLTVGSASTADAGLSQFDYTFSGVLGFTLLSLGVFGPTTVFPRLKQRGVLRRYSTTTIRVWQFFVANVLSNSFIGLLASSLMFVSALLFFDLNMRGNYFNMA
jgi:ABC-2 type transport system permease protein